MLPDRLLVPAKFSREELTALAEPVFDDPSSQALLALSREYKMTVGVGLVEVAEDGRLYNCVVVAMPTRESRFAK